MDQPQNSRSQKYNPFSRIGRRPPNLPGTWYILSLDGDRLADGSAEDLERKMHELMRDRILIAGRTMEYTVSAPVQAPPKPSKPRPYAPASRPHDGQKRDVHSRDRKNAAPPPAPTTALADVPPAKPDGAPQPPAVRSRPHFKNGKLVQDKPGKPGVKPRKSYGNKSGKPGKSGKPYGDKSGKSGKPYGDKPGKPGKPYGGKSGKPYSKRPPQGKKPYSGNRPNNRPPQGNEGPSAK